MQKKNLQGNYENYDVTKLDRATWITIHEPEDTHPNLRCNCGSDSFRVCWWDYPYTGGYCKVVCANCGGSLILIDDYA